MNINVQDTALSALLGEKTEGTASVKKPVIRQEEKRSTIFAGDLNLDPIAERKKKAQEKAMKVMEDAWAQDKAVAKSIAKREDDFAKCQAELKEINDEIGQRNDKEAALRKEYEIDSESEEQKDLELLKKKQDIDKGLVSPSSLSEEESARLMELEKEPRTEYQERVLAVNDERGVYRLKKEEIEKQMKDDVGDITAIKLEALKSSPMSEARKEMEAIYEQASEEIIGMLRQDGMDHLDEMQEENEEKAEKTEEEKKKQEEKTDEMREQRAIEEAMITGSEEAMKRAEAIHRQNEADTEIELEHAVDYNEINASSGDIGKSLQEIKNSMNLLEADLKGIKVDEEV